MRVHPHGDADHHNPRAEQAPRQLTIGTVPKVKADHTLDRIAIISDPETRFMKDSFWA
jgi:hypothetical protein